MPRRLGLIAFVCSLLAFAVVSTTTWTIVRANRLHDVDTSLEAALDVQYRNVSPAAGPGDIVAPNIDGEAQIAWSYFIDVAESRGFSFIPDAASAATVAARVEAVQDRLWTQRLTLVQDRDYRGSVPPTPGDWRIGWREANRDSNGTVVDPNEYVVIATDLRPISAGLSRLAVLLAALTLVAAVILAGVVWSSARRTRPR